METVDAVVAGHICLDVIPQFPPRSLAMVPGALLKVGPAIRSTGGAVANTGIALHRLGMKVRLAAKVGDDLFGRDILSILRGHDASLASGMIISERDTTSYTVVISPPNVDRTFLHCPGANDTLISRDIPDAALKNARLLHFGYPPLMRRMYLRGGAELVKLMARAKRAGLTTSLDMAEPDAASEAGKINWRELIESVLPHVDLFVPSIQELLFMVDRPTWSRFAEKSGGINIRSDVDAALLHRLSDALIGWGAAVVMIKLGDRGAYLRTTGNKSRLIEMGAARPASVGPWLNRELLAPCFTAKVVGTTGSGDCTIAGLLAGLLKGLPAEESLRSAVAVGAASIEAADATSGVPHWDGLIRRLTRGWRQRSSSILS